VISEKKRRTKRRLEEGKEKDHPHHSREPHPASRGWAGKEKDVEGVDLIEKENVMTLSFIRGKKGLECCKGGPFLGEKKREGVPASFLTYRGVGSVLLNLEKKGSGEKRQRFPRERKTLFYLPGARLQRGNDLPFDGRKKKKGQVARGTQGIEEKKRKTGNISDREHLSGG